MKKLLFVVPVILIGTLVMSCNQNPTYNQEVLISQTITINPPLENLQGNQFSSIPIGSFVWLGSSNSSPLDSLISDDYIVSTGSNLQGAVQLLNNSNPSLCHLVTIYTYLDESLYDTRQYEMGVQSCDNGSQNSYNIIIP